MSWRRWKPYVPVARKRARADAEVARLARRGIELRPVELEGKRIAQTFWGQAWCEHLEAFSDYANRLPRGRTYVRNGSVRHLEIGAGRIEAIVSGSDLYEIEVKIATLSGPKWAEIKKRCAGGIGSLLELLQGRLSDAVLEVVTDRERGLFPLPREIRLSCSCPDWATMCKHVAAVLYGVGARLDESPELLFRLRGVDQAELLGIDAASVATATGGRPDDRIAESDLAGIFGIEIADEPPPGKEAGPELAPPERPRTRRRQPRPAKRSRPDDRPVAPAPSGPETIRLRTDFDMTREEFARILGVSVPTLARWEAAAGSLALRSRTLEAWTRIATLTKREAWKLHWERVRASL